MIDLFSGISIPEHSEARLKKQRRKPDTHYRAHIASLCYPEISNELEKTGPFDMPVIKPNIIVPQTIDTTPFDRVITEKSDRNSIVIFYINDDRFATKLSHPWTYTDFLSQYAGVIAPDLSQYIDMDYPDRLYNNYLNKVYAAYWQSKNVNIYPNVTWSLPDSYEYCLSGYPKKSVIAINSKGILNSHFSNSLWLDGYRYVINALEPICILRYGPKICGEDESISIYLKDIQIKRLKDGSERK